MQCPFRALHNQILAVNPLAFSL
jgi:hypothetical protein